MKDVILNVHPEIAGMLLNSALYKYAEGGVKYIELSVGSGDLQKKEFMGILINGVFSEPTATEDKQMITKASEARKGSMSYPPEYTLPEPLQAKNLKPAWREHTHIYKRKSDKQEFSLLIAFPRDKFPRDKVLKVPFQLNSDIPQQRKATFEDIEFRARVGGETFDELLAQFARSVIKKFPDDILEKLAEYADLLCSDKCIEMMYNIKNIEDRIHAAEQSFREVPIAGNLGKKTYKSKVVGLDWVGDENGLPYCALIHTRILTLIKNKNTKLKKFGLRLHAAEGVLQNSTTDENGIMFYAFAFHMFVLISQVKKVNETGGTDKLPFRIGHGVAFLYGLSSPKQNKLDLDLHEFRKFLKDNNIVCEVNPSSNHMLLPGCSKNLISDFISSEIPFTLCTDDDGIFGIHKCSRHRRHQGLAHEYCNAITDGGFMTTEQIDQVIKAGRESAFMFEKGDKKRRCEVTVPMSRSKRKRWVPVGQM